jgi:toxin HigB-1
MIRSFASRETERIWNGVGSRRLPTDIANKALVKLRLTAQGRWTICAFRREIDWKRLRGDRARQHSIRINDQWRICFTWQDGAAYDVEIVDYHG